MVDVLLAHSNFVYKDPKQVRKMRPYPPLATLYAASALRKKGFSVAIFDATLADSLEDFRNALIQSAPEFLVIYEDFFNFIAKMCLSQMRQSAFRMAQTAKDQGVIVIGAGPEIMHHPEAYLEKGFDYALIGEPDNTLVELIQRLSRRQAAFELDIPGLYFLNSNRKICFTGQRMIEKNLDHFEFPAWDLVNMDAYREAWTSAHGYFSLNMVASRGCRFGCTWCSKPIWGNEYTVRSPANVVDEMTILKNRYAPDHIWFADDLFGMTPGWLETFCQSLKKRKAKIPFTIQSRIDLMTEPAVEILADAGCIEAWMGVESGSQKILNAMNKGFKISQVFETCRFLKKNGIRTCFFIQFGYPGETLDDIRKTIQLIRRTIPDDIGISVSYPLPGTPFYEMVAHRMGEKSNWRDSEDIGAIFSTEFETSFYRKLHQVLHRESAFAIRMNGSLDKPVNLMLEEMYAISDQWFELGQMTERCQTRKAST